MRLVWLSVFPVCPEREKKGSGAWEVQKYVNKIYLCRICKVFLEGESVCSITEMAIPCRGIAVIGSIFLFQAIHSLMQEMVKPNTMEIFFKDLSSCVTTVTFISMPVEIQTIQSRASGYEVMMIRVLQGISPLHSSTQQTVPWVTDVFGDLGSLLGSVWLCFIDNLYFIR